MTTGHAEIMQSARDLHHLIRDAVLGQAQDFFDDATALDPGDGMFDDDADTGTNPIEQLVADTQFLAFGFFFGWRASTPAGS